MIAGVGVPQLTAIFGSLSSLCQSRGFPQLQMAGLNILANLAKAIAAGASAAMIGSLLAGTDETPGEVFLHQGRSFKAYRGMGSLGAMARGSADRYFSGRRSHSR